MIELVYNSIFINIIIIIISLSFDLQHWIAIVNNFSGRHFWMLPILYSDRLTPAGYLHDRLSFVEHVNQVCRYCCWVYRYRLSCPLDNRRCRSNRDLNPSRNAGYSFAPGWVFIRFDLIDVFVVVVQIEGIVYWYRYFDDENTQAELITWVWCSVSIGNNGGKKIYK